MGDIRAVLFDFDGTLADSYDAIAASVNHVRASNGLPALSVAEVRVHVGHGPGHLLAHTVGVGDPRRNETVYREHHPTIMKAATRLLPGAAEMLAALKGRGLRLGVCSNKPVGYTRELLDHLHVAAHFDVVIGPEDVKAPKPEPDMLLLALERLQLSAGQALYVGDMRVDVRTARGAGLAVWVVPTGSDSREQLESARPDRLLDNLLEVSHHVGGQPAAQPPTTVRSAAGGHHE